MNTHKASKSAPSLRHNRGFTLMELSIVIVILSLVVGGTLVGKEMIRASELRSGISQLQATDAAINTFIQNYNAIPGDMKNAYDYWPTAGCTNVDVNVAAAGCNGNGDKLIFNRAEAYRLWQHLGLSGLIPKKYTGTSTANEAVLGVNIPATELGGGGFYIEYSSPFEFVIWEHILIGESHYLYFGRSNDAVWEHLPLGPLFLPSEAYMIDSKIDDGDPSRGKVVGGNGLISGLTCLSGNNYNMTKKTPQCAIAYDLGMF